MASRVSAIRRLDGQVVVVVGVTGSPGHVGVPIGQQKARRAVIELRAQPTVKRVARVASGRELGGDVIGIRSPLKIL